MQSRPEIMDFLAKRMDWLSHRQSVLARNISNADMPGHLPHDLREPASVLMFRGRPAAPALPIATDDAHLTWPAGTTSDHREEESSKRDETTPSVRCGRD